MTKPAAVFLQIIGGILLIVGGLSILGDGGPAYWVATAVGAALIWAGGRSARTPTVPAKHDETTSY